MKRSGLFEVVDILQLFDPKTKSWGPKVHSDKSANIHDFCTRPPFLCAFFEDLYLPKT